MLLPTPGKNSNFIVLLGDDDVMLVANDESRMNLVIAAQIATTAKIPVIRAVHLVTAIKM